MLKNILTMTAAFITALILAGLMGLGALLIMF